MRFRYPVAVTAGVWAECVTKPEGVACPNEAGRLFVLLDMLGMAILEHREGDRVDFDVPVGNDTARETRRSFASMPSAGRVTTRSQS